jgi:hypothetical protein
MEIADLQKELRAIKISKDEHDFVFEVSFNTLCCFHQSGWSLTYLKHFSLMKAT